MKKCGSIEYKMPEKTANEILKMAGKKAASNPQKVLCDYVNEQCGLLYNCERVLIY